MESSRPLVSIGLPVYNGEMYVARAIDSLLSQDMDDFEIVICDNASVDSTAEICARYAERDSRIHVYSNPENIGLVGNFNRTFELSTGKYFKWAAHDDWHAPESLRLTVARLEANPAAVACATGVSIVNEFGEEYERWIPTVDLSMSDPHQRFRRLIWTLRDPHLLFGLLRSSALRQTSLMRSYLGSDRALLAELSLLGPILHTPERLHIYTVSASARKNYRPSIHYDPKNKGKLPLRTWRLIYKHVGIVLHSNLAVRHKLLLATSVVGRFGVRDARRLAAEIYHCVRILAGRAAAWRPWAARTGN